jgi:HSP20 family protein
MASRTTATQAVKEAPEPKALQLTATKALATEDIFTEFDRIYDSIARRAFEIFSGGGHGFGHDLEHWHKAESELLHPVHMKVTESDEALSVTAEVPGFEAKDLEIKLEPTRLTVSGKRETKAEQKKGKTTYEEHCSNEILRIVELPAEVDASKAQAKLKNGMLEMQLPKGKPAKTTRIEVKAG